MKIIKEGTGSILLIAQDQPEIEMLMRFQAGLVAVRVDLGAQVRLRVMPDLNAMPKGRLAEYERLTVDDMLTKCAELGVHVDRNVLRDDLIRILELAKEDQAKAQELAAKARPAMGPRPLNLTPQQREGVAGARTGNAIAAGGMPPGFATSW